MDQDGNKGIIDKPINHSVDQILRNQKEFCRAKAAQASEPDTASILVQRVSVSRLLAHP